MKSILTINFLTGRQEITKKSSFRQFQLLCVFKLFILSKTALQHNLLDLQVTAFYGHLCQLAIVSQLVPSLNLVQKTIFFFQKFLFHSGLKGLSSEIRSAYGGAALFEWEKPNTSKPQYVQTVDYGKDVNRVQKVRFYAHKHNVEEATVYISFAVASMFCTKSQGWEQISVSFQNLDCPWSFFFTAVMLQYIITASFYLGLHMKFSSIKQLIVPARCLYSFIY